MKEPTKSADSLHRSVLLEETVQALSVGRGGVYVDATLGMGGHAEAILETPRTVVIGIDQDAEAINLAKTRLARFGDRLTAVQSNFSEIKALMESLNISKVDGILADLGVSSMQLDNADRGFSFRGDAPLDMRMDRAGGETAAELLARLSEVEIANVIYQFGEEKFSRRIARRIVERRQSGRPVTTTAELSELVERSVKRKSRDKIHPATRTFQALRIAVNREIDILEQFIRDAVDVLAADGVIALISFHSLEDRIVKQTFRKLSGRCICPPRMPQCVCGAAKMLEIITRRPITAGDVEIDANPRARSAKLRAARRSS